MQEIASIFSCPTCERQFDAAGNWLRRRAGDGLGLPVARDCGQEDCQAVAASLVRQRADLARGFRRGAMGTGTKCRTIQNSKPKSQNPTSTGRKPYVDPEDRERVMDGAARGDGFEVVVKTSPSPIATRPSPASARDFETSANGVLLKFFKLPENFNKPFLSSDLEDLTRAAGHPSTRMNNRAIWLREHLPAGWYLDNDPNGAAWGLARGSWYRVCFIEDATSLTEAEKHGLLVKCGLRQPEQGEFGVRS